MFLQLMGEYTQTTYIRYAYCSSFINFNDIKVIVELGSGSGKLVEVIKKLHPHITFLLFDISPQLYVAERYLSTVFPDLVISYKKNRELTAIPPLEEGKIYMFGSWHFPFIEKIEFDLFCNLASFQEMEPNVVANYLKYVNGQAKALFLHSKMDGKELATAKGEFGVMEQTKLEHFKKSLPNFKMIDIQPALMETGRYKWTGYMDSFWKKINM